MIKTAKYYTELAKKYKEVMKTRRALPKGAVKDIVKIIKAKETGTWEEVYQSRLYWEFSAEYCEYLQIIS